MSYSNIIGVDLAKSIFQLHITDRHGKCLSKKRVTRSKLLTTLANQPPALIGIEACGGAHYWAKCFESLGHTVKMMSPQFVKPYVKSNKNDRNDAEAIAEAVTRPTMRFVPIKNVAQQELQLLHSVRQLSVKQRTAQSNQIRGLLAEFGIVLNIGLATIRKLPAHLSAESAKLTPISYALFEKLYEHFKYLDEVIMAYDRQIQQAAEQDPRCVELMRIEGVGPKTATAAVATISDPSVFKRGRDVSAWLGLVPKQYSSGNKIHLGGISKRGNCHLRTLLIHGARSVVNLCHTKNDKRSLWIADKKVRCGSNKAAVALANKNARIIWAILSTGESYRPSQVAIA